MFHPKMKSVNLGSDGCDALLAPTMSHHHVVNQDPFFLLAAVQNQKAVTADSSIRPIAQNEIFLGSSCIPTSDQHNDAYYPTLEYFQSCIFPVTNFLEEY